MENKKEHTIRLFMGPETIKMSSTEEFGLVMGEIQVIQPIVGKTWWSIFKKRMKIAYASLFRKEVTIKMFFTNEDFVELAEKSKQMLPSKRK